MAQIKVGDCITYSPFGGGFRTGVVTEWEADIKNGRPGFSMTTDQGEHVWGYDDQVVS